jgi:uncharacterized protein (TIGR00369 family)
MDGDPMSPKVVFPSHRACFACGDSNPGGLGLVFEGENGRVQCRTRLDARYQSYNGLVHGGILAAIADSAMVNLVYRERGGRPLTGSLFVKYKASVHVDEELLVEARIVRSRHSTIWASCEILTGDRLCVAAEAAFRMNHED